MRQSVARGEGSLSEYERVAVLLPFVGCFDEPGSWGKWGGGKQAGGTMQAPFFDFSEEASAFIKACYEGGWVRGEDWAEWTETALHYRDEPELFERADALTIARCLTAYIRADRFSEGTLAHCFESGAIGAILRRLSVVSG